MKKYLLATLVALPLAAVGQQQASAGGCCYSFSGSYHFKICASCNFKCCREPFCPCSPCGNGCCGDGCGLFGCPPTVPGPWYQYWPYDGYSQVAPASPGGWSYEQHFQTPAPTGYPYWPNPMMAGSGYNPPVQMPTYQPVGYYPQAPGYWYGW
jgi:hypothetical protein